MIYQEILAKLEVWMPLLSKTGFAQLLVFR